MNAKQIDPNNTRRGDWFQTFLGEMFYPGDPRPEEVFIHDIAHALSNVCRFAGHCRDFYCPRCVKAGAA